jgi:hypothetical protein
MKHNLNVARKYVYIRTVQYMLYTHTANKRHKHELRISNTKLSSYRKVVYHVGFKLFSVLPFRIKSLNYDIKVFKSVLDDYLLSHSCFVE